jgi:hypothetical protein
MCLKKSCDPRAHLELKELAKILAALGCPPEKTDEMATQLEKRARQLAEQKDRSYEEALTHLLELMRQGWAAKEKGM